ncbi:MAG: glycerol-3-phosphate dehydrogenase/oxidase [Chloroflexi bacterium]|nr:MAG: glycerol-3-phosphate dehydrogenase/oxidase [Chloroflexota bacterium]
MNRTEKLNQLKAQPRFTVLIVGAGINGIGTFRDLALQGVDVLIVDRADYSAGASAGSSHMAHGGIRYLENGEFRLVREALHERNLLIENAPHYVSPLRTTIPIFRYFSGLLNAPLKFLDLRNKPAERGAIVIKLGLMMYDWYTRDHRVTPTHRFYGRKASLERYPKMNPNIRFTATYYDGFIAVPERLALEVLMDGEREGARAIALNYMSLIGAEGDSVQLRDELSGEVYTVQPQIVINAAGPWIDFANQAMKRPTRFIGGTKGSHLVLNHPQLREQLDGEIFFENQDGRIVLILPYFDRVMIGTTDIPIDNPDDARCTEEEIEYMLGMVRRVFPDIVITRDHIVYQFSGVRPLPASDADNPGQISRDHSIKVLEAGDGLAFPVLSLVGGKWTTFRAFSEQVTDEVLRRLGKERRTSTRNLAIGGGINYPKDETARNLWLEQVAEDSGIALPRLRQLFDRYGTRAADIARYIAEEADAPLTHHAAYSQREIAYLCQHEQVVHLDDLLLRRTMIAMHGDISGQLIAEMAEVAAQALGWDEARKAEELERTLTILREEHGLTETQLALSPVS